jgi:limonene-1,2-epoxide hydrolase
MQKEPPKLTAAELKICTALEVYQMFVGWMKAYFNTPIQVLPRVNEDGEISTVTSNIGISCVVGEADAQAFIATNRAQFKKKGFLLATFEGNDQKKYIALLKGSNELMITRWRKPNGATHGIDNQALVATLKTFQDICDFEIMHVGRTTVAFRCTSQPENVEAFAEQLAQFCPALVHKEGTSMAGLVESIQNQTLIQLTWS